MKNRIFEIGVLLLLLLFLVISPDNIVNILFMCIKATFAVVFAKYSYLYLIDQNKKIDNEGEQILLTIFTIGVIIAFGFN
jgi:uncharacterized membrane protein SpoIIM required for sporulation